MVKKNEKEIVQHTFLGWCLSGLTPHVYLWMRLKLHTEAVLRMVTMTMDEEEDDDGDGDGDGHLMMVQAKRKMHISYYIITNNAPKMEAPIGSSKAPGQSGVETVTS